MQVFYWLRHDAPMYWDNTAGNFKMQVQYADNNAADDQTQHTIGSVTVVPFTDFSGIDSLARSMVKTDILSRFSHTLTDDELIKLNL